MKWIVWNLPDDSEGVHWVRLYYEFRRAGGPLDCDVVVTECVNDALCELGLALRRSEPTSPHLRRRDWPSARPLPPAGAVLDADVIWLDEAAELYLHVGIETSVQLAKIGALLDGYFNRSVAQPCDRDAPWTIGEPCIAKYAPIFPTNTLSTFIVFLLKWDFKKARPVLK